MISIQTNVNSLVAQQNLSVNSAFQSKTIAQLTSGYRINQSGDDAAGLAVANKFRSTVAELTQGVANGNDATAQLQIMDGGMNNISQILDRLKTLATQSASGTFTGNRTTVNSEFQNDLLEIDRQAQSIGLDTGGAFAKNLNVYLGTGSGSTSLQNGVVTLGLAQSAVDSQSLGMKGLQVVNATLVNNVADTVTKDIGTTSAWSVKKIIDNAGSGTDNNHQAVAGFAALQFTGAGFSDDGKIGISVNLGSVTDTTTLAAAVNSAIQQAGKGTTPAATAFQNANIVASVYTDKLGGQALSFTSSTSAFQVQAGDQIANALLGNVSTVNGVAKGTAVAGASVTGVNTSAGAGFSQNQVVKLVVTGGGLDSPITLQVATTSGAVTTAGAITDLKNKFGSSTALQAAGLTMTGDPSTVGTTALSFASATGQKFNVQVTGDTANLLGLGSFLAGNTGEADYTAVTSRGGAYDAAAVSGTTNMEISVNGAQSTALAGIDLSQGAHALAASVTGTGLSGSNASITFTGTDNLTIDSTNSAHTFATQAPITLTATHAATSGSTAGAIASGAFDYSANAMDALTFSVKVNNAGSATQISLAPTVTAATSGKVAGTLTAGSIVYGGAVDALTFDIKVNNAGSATQINLAPTVTAATSAKGTGHMDATTFVYSAANMDGVTFGVQVNNGATQAIDLGTGKVTDQASLLTTINGQLAGAHAYIDASNGNKLTIESDTTGSGNSSKIEFTDITAGSNTKLGMNFDPAWSGTDAVTNSISSDTQLLNKLNSQLGALGAHAYFDAANSNKLTLASDSVGSGNASSIEITAASGNTPTRLGLGVVAQTSGTAASSTGVTSDATLLSTLNSQLGALGARAFFDGANSNKLTIASNTTGAGNASSIQITAVSANTTSRLGLGVVAQTSGTAATATIQDIAGQLQTALGANAAVTVVGGQLSIASTNKGAGEFFSVSAGTGAGANLGITPGVTVHTGTSSSTADIVDNLNKQFGASQAWQNAGLTAVQTDSAGTPGANNYITIKSNNGTQFRLNALASGTADIGFGKAGITFSGATPTSSVTMASLNAYGVSQTGAQAFTALQYGSDKQALTFSATDTSGALETQTITLDNNTGKSIDDAVAYVNQQLQQHTEKPALQKIVAVKQNVGSQEQINFVSSLSNFTVGVSGTATNDGVNGGAATQLLSGVVGSGSNMAIDTQAGALAAITAIASAVGKLGSAQAAVGKGQNQLNYAVTLAQSQITNFSAAESQIRDTNVAQQAANLSKAQVLSQASIAAMAQANSAPQAVLSLLRG